MPSKSIPRKYASSADSESSDDSTNTNWPTDLWMSAWMGMPWIEIGLKNWTKWLELWGIGALTGQNESASSDDRRGPPWLPQIASTVMPLRRSGDEPGAEAEKVSMRIHVPAMPWQTSGGSVIAIDSLRPRSAASVAAAFEKYLPGTKH